MNILVIGNGFDLAHGLPTKYEHFLKFVKVYIENRDIFIEGQSIREKWLKSNEENQKFMEFFGDLREHNKEAFLELDQLISDNIWLEYFLSIYEERIKNDKDGWIDFESEISGVIQLLDDDMHGLSQVYNIEDIVLHLSNKFLEAKYSDFIAAVQPINPIDNGFSEGITFKEIRNELLNDLNRIIRALEIYLCEYVEKIKIGKKSPDIDDLEIDFILSFNYTHTFSKLYDVSSRSKQEVAAPFDYIHGEADINNTIESNNMVLGIDEYLSKKKRNKNVDFIAFKKYYQRIHKQTGCKYKEWVDEIETEYEEYQKHQKDAYIQIVESIKDGSLTQYPYQKQKYSEQLQEECPTHNLYIFGHSLDVTDKDILRDLILHDNVHTTIFCLNKDVMGQQIANLVKVIGQEKLIRRTGGSTKTIEFKQQQDMVEKEKDTQ